MNLVMIFADFSPTGLGVFNVENLNVDQNPFVCPMWEDWEAFHALLTASRNTGLWQTADDHQLKDLKASKDIRATSLAVSV